eukprot:gene38618-50714_t
MGMGNSLLIPARQIAGVGLPNDFILSKLFSDSKNKDLLIDFINSGIGWNKQITDVEYISNIEIPGNGICFVSMDVERSKHLLHIQCFRENLFSGQELSTVVKTYLSQIKKERQLSTVKGVLSVAILSDFMISPVLSSHVTVYPLQNDPENAPGHKSVHSNLVLMELPKYNCIKDKNGWCDLFTGIKYRELGHKSDQLIKRAYDILDTSNWSEEDLNNFQAFELHLQQKSVERAKYRQELQTSVSESISQEIENVIVTAISNGFPAGVWKPLYDEVKGVDDIEFTLSNDKNTELMSYMTERIGNDIAYVIAE